jgi:hypothetical protein
MKLAKALEKLRQEPNNDPNFQKFSGKIEDLVIQYKSLEKLNNKRLKIENFAKSERQKLFDNYSDLCKSVGGIDNLIQAIRDIKAPASNPKPEIQAMTHEMQDNYNQLKAELDKVREENQILKGKINKLENKEAEALTEEHPQIKELKQEIERLKAQVADLTQPNEVDNTKEKTGFFKKLKAILNKIKDWLKNPLTKSKSLEQTNAAESGDNSQSQNKFDRVKKVFKVIGEFLRKVAQYTGLLRFARTFPHRYRHNSTWGKIGKGTLEVLGGIVLAGGVYMVPFYIYKTAKYNHKDVMHQKYSKDGTGDRNGKGGKGYYKNNAPNPDHVLIYKKGGDVKKEFFIRPDAKDRELAFLTRHPIPNTEKGNEDYEAKKSQITKLTKSEVKALRKRNISETNDNSSEPNGWSVISMEAYNELRSQFPESPKRKEGEN